MLEIGPKHQNVKNALELVDESGGGVNELVCFVGAPLEGAVGMHNEHIAREYEVEFDLNL